MKVPLALAILLLLLASPAQAADPWKPVLDLFRRPAPAPSTTHPPLPEPNAPAAIERALLDAELQEAVRKAQEAAERAEEAAKAVEPPRDAKSPVPPRPKVRTKAPLSLAAPPRQPTTPEENDGSWLAPCFMVCGHVQGKTKAQLDADEAYWRVTARQKKHGNLCIVNTCPTAVPADILKELKIKMGIK